MMLNRLKATLGLLAASLFALSIVSGNAFANGDDRCADARVLALVNGKIITVNPDDAIVSSVVIRDGRFAVVGRKAKGLGPCATVINLRGRTVIPGLIDSHAHYLRAGLRPGHDTRAIETAFSISEVQEVIAARAAGVPAGEFVTAITGFHQAQFTENRLPTLAELDAAAPNHPVYLQRGFNGPSVTNSLGKAFFEAAGIVVDDDGSLNAGAAFGALAAVQTFDDKVRGTRDLMAHSVGIGLTGVADASGGGGSSGTAFWFDSSAEAYAPALALWRDGGFTVRVRASFISRDDENLTALSARIANAFMGFGDGMFRVAGLGEQVTSPSPSPAYTLAVQKIAANGWSHRQHSSSVSENLGHLAAFQAADAIAPIADLHWSLEHVFSIDAATLDALIAIGAGVGVQDQRFLSSSTTRGGPPYRLIVDSGINAGAGTDSTNVAPLSPWLGLYYMTTGKNAGGNPVNAGQTISRLEALRLYTIGSAWLSKDENELGSIEVGKLADLVVLSDDYLTVADEDIKTITSVLTIVDGKIVHSDGTLRFDDDDDDHGDSDDSD